MDKIAEIAAAATEAVKSKRIPHVAESVQLKIAPNEYRPFLIVKVKVVDGRFLLTGFLFLNLWNDDVMVDKISSLAITGSGDGSLRHVLDVAQGDEIGQWRYIE